MNDPIEFVAYDPAWPQLFAQERTLLMDYLERESIVDIAHFGSTAVLGLSAKPIIDIVLKTPDLESARDVLPSKLATLGYLYWRDDPSIERLYFVKGMPPHGARRTHHLHVIAPDGALWRQVAFARYLIDHPETAAEYEALKADLALRFRNNRGAYTDGKADFIASVMAKIQNP
jgi:GrpB-like predicted nucleotidyltransferase (UPF0157 family)